MDSVLSVEQKNFSADGKEFTKVPRTVGKAESGSNSISLLVRSDSDKCLESRTPLTHLPNTGHLMP